ncbi:MAG: hypothetical protein KDB07_01220 [Planctomycetes bacterium]|nr:hypothetical protein [Planctomycetota bacterium]
MNLLMAQALASTESAREQAKPFVERAREMLSSGGVFPALERFRAFVLAEFVAGREAKIENFDGNADEVLRRLEASSSDAIVADLRAICGL